MNTLSLMTFSMLKDAFHQQMDAETLCQVAAENGMSAMDLMTIDPVVYGKERLLAAMKNQGIRCGCLIANISFYSHPERVEDELRAALELAAEFETKELMVIPGASDPEDQAACGKLTREQQLDSAVQHFATAVEMAKEYGIRIGFENTPHAFKYLASPEDCQYVLDRVPGLGLIFDTGNFRVADTRCDELAIYEQLKSYITRVHLKDVVIGDFETGEACVDGQKIRAVVTGSGVIPIQELVERLIRDGYQGDFAVEYASPDTVHGSEEAAAIAPYCDYIRRAMTGTVIRPEYVHIKGVDIPASRIFFGTALFPMVMGKDVNELLDAVFAAGVNAFDTARGYGLAEKSLGDWIQARNNRDKVVILSKCGNIDGEGKVCVNRQVIERELAESLATLRTDYIDIYLLHRDDPNTPVGEVIEALNEAKQQGKIKIFGVSNWTDARIREGNEYAAAHGLEGFTASSPNYGLAEQVEDPWGGECVTISGPEYAEARRWYAENQMPVIAYSSLGRGFFSGRFASGDYETAKKVMDPFAQKGYLHECNMRHLKAAERIAEREGVTVAQVAMAYIFHSPMNVFAVVSSKNPERIVENVAASRIVLSAEDMAALEA